jgi:amino acid transporter
MVLGFGLWYLVTPHDAIVLSSKAIPGIADIFQGAALAFFAFTGFEDLANVAEEVKQPEKNIPRAILSSLGMAGLLYISVSWVATAIITGSELSQSSAPLLDVVTKSYPGIPDHLFTIIALFAVSNTALLNYITASRLLYGMSKTKLLPLFLQSVHKKFHTPYVAILVILPLVLGLSLTSNLSELASSTSAIVLIVFSLSSTALARIKFKERRKDNINITAFKIPVFVPYLVIVLNLTAISFLPLRNIIPAVTFIGIVCIITWILMKSMASIK